MCNKPWCTCEDNEHKNNLIDGLECDLAESNRERDRAYVEILVLKGQIDDERAKRRSWRKRLFAELVSVPRYDIGGDCDGDSGHCYAEMELDPEGGFVHHAAIVTMLNGRQEDVDAV